jgi:hypothetical protein
VNQRKRVSTKPSAVQIVGIASLKFKAKLRDDLGLKDPDFWYRYRWGVATKFTLRRLIEFSAVFVCVGFILIVVN